MLVQTLDGKKYQWKIPEKLSKGNKRAPSAGHTTTRNILQQLYPMCGIYEEIPIVVEGRKKLFLDFYIPTIQQAIEVHGRQHYEYIPFYHRDKLQFLMSKANDRKKQEWCELNSITLIILPFNESEEEWISRLQLKIN